MLDKSPVEQISDAVRDELDGVLDVKVLFSHFLRVARIGCMQHLVDEEVDVVDRANQIVSHCGLQHLHHLNFLALILQKLKSCNVTQLQ